MAFSLPKAGPSISAVVPLFNKEGTILRCLASIGSQLLPVSEVIVVDDGSTDGSRGAAEDALSELGVRGQVLGQANAGVSSARNAGILQASGTYIAFLDADDEWVPEFILRMTSLIADFPEAALYGCAHRHSDGNRCRIVRPAVPDGFRGFLPDFFQASSGGSAVNSSKAVVAKAAIQEIGGFPVGASVGEDLYVWMRLASRHKVAFEDFVGSKVTIEPDLTRQARRGVPYPIIHYARNGLQSLPPWGRIFLRRILLTHCLNRCANRDPRSVSECASVARPIFPMMSRMLALLAVAPAWIAPWIMSLGRKFQRLFGFAHGAGQGRP